MYTGDQKMRSEMLQFKVSVLFLTYKNTTMSISHHFSFHLFFRICMPETHISIHPCLKKLKYTTTITHRIKAFNDVVLSASLPLYIINIYFCVTQKAFWHAKAWAEKGEKNVYLSEIVFPAFYIYMNKTFLVCLYLSSLAHKFQDRVYVVCHKICVCKSRIRRNITESCHLMKRND